MTWEPYYRGDGIPRKVTLPPPPPWRTFPRNSAAAQVFISTPELREAVNAALCLRRPLLLKGPAGSGKSTVIEQVAAELMLEPVLRWHITSRSTVADALYRYDALGRIYAQRQRPDVDARSATKPDSTGLPSRAVTLADPGSEDIAESDDIAPFLQLGPLGSALVPRERPRALLIDELDKSDLDLPGDLLDVLERGEFEIPEIIREKNDQLVELRMWNSDETCQVRDGRVQCTQFPFIVMTSNAEQELPPAFLRRCVPFTMPKPDAAMLRSIIRGWLEIEVSDRGGGAEESSLTNLVKDFIERMRDG
jgi:MoxR-like ATPase